MQLTFGLGEDAQLLLIRDCLRVAFGHVLPAVRREPVGQLVKSLISSRTRDAVSLRAYDDLRCNFPGWSAVAAAGVAEIEAVLADVTFADAKAPQLQQALRLIAAEHPDFDLHWLRDGSVDQATRWLRQLPGVGCEVSAATLNLSTLDLPAFVVDTHMVRVLGRYGIVPAKTGAEATYRAVMGVAAGWTSTDLAELHYLLKQLGQTLCRAERTDCHRCPLARSCRSSNPRLGRGPPTPAADLNGTG